MTICEKFIEKSNKKHQNKYDYSKVNYINSLSKVTIICPIHGEFEQTPAAHARGDGCPKCGNLKRGGKQRLTLEDFISRANSVHNNKYDYSKTTYVNANTKVCIICPKHGEFEMSPMNHLLGQGCPKCVGKHLTQDEWIERFNEIHHNKYDYSKTVYVDQRTKIKIICPIHGEFEQAPTKHVTGQGCPQCGVTSRAEKNKLGKDAFILRSIEIHGDKYDYSEVEYINTHTFVNIICREHGPFKQRPYDHLHGHGCPLCSESHLERQISLILDEANIRYVRQFKAQFLGKMSLDFYLIDYNIGIECQGGQHFKPIPHFGGKKELKIILERDSRKHALCAENNINLIYFLDPKQEISEEHQHIYTPTNTFSSTEDILTYIKQKES